MTSKFRHAAAVCGFGICAWCAALTQAFGNTLIVTTTDDSGSGSLREAIAAAAAGDTILFAVSGTIVLANGPLTVSNSVSIVGPGASELAIEGNGSSRVFVIGSRLVPAAVSISGVTIRNGRTSDGGGGILNESTLTLDAATLSANTAAQRGGAVLNHGTLHVVRTVIEGNAAFVGGGIANDQGSVSILQTTISRNSADGLYGGVGGGIASVGTLDIRDSTISENVATWKGGAIAHSAGYMTVANSTIVNNRNTYAGTGAGCQCSGGGGIFSQDRALITNSTIAGNTAFVGGGNITTLVGSLELKATLLAKGSAGPDCYVAGLGSIKSDGYNLADDSSCSAVLAAVGDRNDVEAGLTPMGLQDNGGATSTVQLLASSPAIDAVPPDYCPSADQRGVARPQGAACDAGAYEREASPYTAQIEAPIKPDGSTVFSANRGVIPVKFMLTMYGAATCDLPRAVLGVATLGGNATGPVSDAAYELPADDGSLFRVEQSGCEYVYNLGAGGLAPGTYWTSISIDGLVVGTAVFGIK